jgi:GT2 family glycosyltransferase
MTPRCTVVTVVRDPGRADLLDVIESVRAQTLVDHEHVLVDDGSHRGYVRRLLSWAASSDPRTVVVRRTGTDGSGGAGNDGLEAANGEFVTWLDPGDRLDPDALSVMVEALADTADVGYADHEVVDRSGRLLESWLKPDHSPERLRCQDYVGGTYLARRSLVDALGGFRPGYEGDGRYDLLLRLTERVDRVVHVRQVLFRRPPSTAGPQEAARRAVADHCARVGIEADVRVVDHGRRVVRRSADRPLVSVVVPTRGTSGEVWGSTRCFVVEAIRSICERSTHQELEFVVVHDDETPTSVIHALRRVAGERLRLVPYGRPFNFSDKVNLGIAAAEGDLVLILNDDTELIEPTSIEVLVGHLDDPDVAMVGAALLFADGTLQHGGHVYHHTVGHACFGWPGDSAGPRPMFPLGVDRECSGVTAAAALVRRSAVEAIGGFDVELPLNYNDVDVSLRLRAAGHRIVWTPWARWYHFESRTRDATVSAAEAAFLERRWGNEIADDPYYHPLLAPGRSDWLERPGPRR